MVISIRELREQAHTPLEQPGRPEWDRPRNGEPDRMDDARPVWKQRGWNVVKFARFLESL